MSQRLLVRIGLGLVLVGAIASWSAAHRRFLPMGLVVITLDTTRADRLSPYGSMDVSLPHLERLAREGVVFDDASSVAPLTLPAHTSLFTGLWPPHHGVRDNADAPLDGSYLALAEVLKAQGFHTGAFVGSMVLAADRGLSQGFDQYLGVHGANGAATALMQRRGDEVINDAIQWLDSLDGAPFFLWAHLYDAHRPYDPPEPYHSRYGHDPYVGEIAYADSQVGRLLDAIERKGLLDRVVVVVVGDHGESLGDHGEQDHGIFVYQEVLHIPLIIRAPALTPGRVGAVTRSIDVFPTVLELLGIERPRTDGVSLVDAMKRGQGLDLESYSESLYPERFGWSPLYVLRQGRYKLIDAPRPELYDLDRDPFEQQNVYADRPSVASAMTRRLDELKKRNVETTTTRARVSPDVQARLASLGYMASAIALDPSRPRTGPDPKDCIGIMRRPSDNSSTAEVEAAARVDCRIVR